MLAFQQWHTLVYVSVDPVSQSRIYCTWPSVQRKWESWRQLTVSRDAGRWECNNFMTSLGASMTMAACRNNPRRVVLFSVYLNFSKKFLVVEFDLKNKLHGLLLTLQLPNIEFAHLIGLIQSMKRIGGGDGVSFDHRRHRGWPIDAHHHHQANDADPMALCLHRKCTQLGSRSNHSAEDGTASTRPNHARDLWYGLNTIKPYFFFSKGFSSQSAYRIGSKH